MRNIIITALLSLIFLQASCSWAPDISDVGLPRVHKIDVPQGNVVEQDQINQLRPGMTRQQVRFLMGTPMLVDSFHANRWDYLYRFKPGYGEIKTQQASLYFNEQGKLVNIQGTFRPGEEAKKQHTTTEIVVVPLEDFDELETEDKSYWGRFVNFFSWSDEHEGISSNGGDIPVGSRGEGEVQGGTMDKSPQTQGNEDTGL